MDYHLQQRLRVVFLVLGELKVANFVEVLDQASMLSLSMQAPLSSCLLLQVLRLCS